MPSAIATQGKPLRVCRHKFLAADLPALTETSIFGVVPGVPCKGYGTVRVWIGGTTQSIDLKFKQRPERNIAAGSTSYSWTQTGATQTIPAGPSTQPTPVNVIADELDITITPAVATDVQIEVELFP